MGGGIYTGVHKIDSKREFARWKTGFVQREGKRGSLDIYEI
jgi:hypothetical protein